MTQQSGGAGIPVTQSVAGVLAGNILTPSFAAESVPAELSYVQTTSNFTGAGSGTDVAVTGMTATVVVGSRPVMVEFYCAYVQKGSAAGAIVVKLHDDTAGAFVQLVQLDLALNSGLPVVLLARLAPAAGSRAYTVYAQYTGGGSAATLFAGVTDPMWFQVREV